MPPKKRPKTTYTKVITKRSGKTKVKEISEKKYKRKLERAIKSEARGKRKKVTGTTTATTKRQTISKKKDKGRKKTFVGTTTRQALLKNKVSVRLVRKKKK
jgi:hypothetical protein